MAIPSHTAGGYILFNSIIIDADKFFSISGSIFPSITDNRNEPYMIPNTAKIDKTAAIRLLRRIREDTPAINVPIKMDAAIGISGIDRKSVV